ncbi:MULTISPECIES: peptide deformylase [Myroides]|uniref:Peptide deformylase n=1 Tax=Myroides profundi TaxID=480520 RepID=A0AAJ5BCL9_MYRPR|nr:MULTISPECIES: peptide deformylase [Myroides]AJH13284.1 peptide deformylase [Myroides profundi]MCO7721817.1 peptide deformylase [Myroides odoratimimus]SEQ05867.1 peptide deformylase [Myroides profundi]
MKLPILAYGNKTLKVDCDAIDSSSEDLNKLIDNMWETMENAYGCGLAAPQIGETKQLFVVDSIVMYENAEEDERKANFAEGDTGMRETFINARIIGKSDETWDEIEGCLSIPDIFKRVTRPWSITIEYLDRDFKPHTKTFHGTTARIIQHEYDHTRGVLFTDRLSSLTKKLIGTKLNKIMNGKVFTDYKMKP